MHGILSIRLKALNLLIYPPVTAADQAGLWPAQTREDRGRGSGNRCVAAFNRHKLCFNLLAVSLSPLQPMVKPSPWGGHQGNGWGSGGVSWGRDHRRGSGMGVPGSVSHVSPLKKPFSSNVIAPPKFPRSGGSLGPKSWIEENMFRTDSNSNTLLPLQVSCLWVFVLGGLACLFFLCSTVGISGLKGGKGLETACYCVVCEERMREFQPRTLMKINRKGTRILFINTGSLKAKDSSAIHSNALMLNYH